MSFADAERELGDAIEAEFGDSSPEPVAEAPAEQSPQAATPEGSITPPEDAAPAEPVDTFDGGQFNPDTLPEELQPGWKQLQAAFTKRTQEIAEQRRQFEELGDVETLRQARELQTRLSDPSNWVALHEELTRELQARGLSPAQAASEAASQIENAGQPTPGPEALDALVREDPELAPLVQHLKRQQESVDSLRAELDARDARAQQQAEYMAMVGELQRSEAAIREQRPDYEQPDIDMVYEVSSFHNGDLHAAQARIEEYVTRRIERYMAQKSSVTAGTPEPLGGGGGVTQTPVDAALNLDDAETRAMEELRQLGISLDTAL